MRYVGRERAAAIHASGLVPREWLWTQVVARPSFSVSVNAPYVAGNMTYFVGNFTKQYLAFTFTSTVGEAGAGLRAVRGADEAG